ncbi:MAG: response regulator [Asticcacaulis sp.]
MPHTPLKTVLYIEDDEALGRLLQKRMQRRGLEVELSGSAEHGIGVLAQQSFDLVLLDYNLPGMNGLEMLKALKARGSRVPVVILTAGGDERIALEAMEQGAADYAVKDVNQTYLDLLPAVMQAAFTKERLLRENERQREELKAAKERAEAASQAKTDFLATMSHEIRTPLNVVTGLSDILIRSPLNDDQFRIVETLRTNAGLLLRLINDLLDISRIEDNRIELESAPFRPTDMMEDLRLMFAQDIERKGLDFAIGNELGDVSVLGDRTRLQQVVMNLVSNALKFTVEGEIGLSGEVEVRDGVAQLVFRVHDTGIGIPEDRLAQIFDKFTQADASITRRFGGSGLGLSIARALTEAMKGAIAVESEEGRGSVFTVRLSLPVAAAPQAAPQVERVPQALTTRPRVLIVEDYQPNALVATLMLEEMGYEADAASSGTEALDRLQEADAGYHAILMDVQMHDMDGFETTRRIREIEAAGALRNRIIGVTAHALAGDRERCLEAGMDDYLSKPIQPALLAQKLDVVR